MKWWPGLVICFAEKWAKQDTREEEEEEDEDDEEEEVIQDTPKKKTKERRGKYFNPTLSKNPK